VVVHGSEHRRVLLKERPRILPNERHESQQETIIEPATRRVEVPVNRVAPRGSLVTIVRSPPFERRALDTNVLVDDISRDAVV